MITRLSDLCSELPDNTPHETVGSVSAASGSVLHTKLTQLTLGDLCEVSKRDGSVLPAQVVSFSTNGTQLAPFGPLDGVGPGAKIVASGHPPLLSLPREPIGGVYSCLGEPLEGVENQQPFGHFRHNLSLQITKKAPTPLVRIPISQQMKTGVRAIDYCCPIGYGQRIGLFAGPGVGKSTLLGMIAKGADVDRVIIALVGERGREVREFIEDCLGEEGLKKAVLFVSTSDECAVRRKLAAFSATRLAEYYRDKGERVLLLVDSLTRTARATRDLSLAAGELPVRQGYTASVFDELPRLIERAGTNSEGSITAIYTVLTSYQESMDILSEEVKSLLDGHIVLDRVMAEQGMFPAIDLTCSISRLLSRIFNEEQITIARTIVRILSRLKQDKDLVLLGGHADKELSFCLDREQALRKLFSQTSEISIDEETPRKRLHELVRDFQVCVAPSS